ncbi:hypothetical protein EDC94DRAFT_688272 [Helicostylum pulchrum]|nr:hypothetical protein EDC94DRAFT_688272 [Helicostylum pulchrum]
MYVNWEEKSPLIHPYYWISIPELIKYLHDLRRYIICTPSKLSEAHVPKILETELVCTKSTRFPSDINYVCEGLGTWKITLDMLQLAANVMINKNKLERKYPIFQTAGEVEIFALEKINCLIYLIQQEHDVIMNQLAFEKFYGLVWEEN